MIEDPHVPRDLDKRMMNEPTSLTSSTCPFKSPSCCLNRLRTTCGHSPQIHEHYHFLQFDNSSIWSIFRYDNSLSWQVTTNMTANGSRINTVTKRLRNAVCPIQIRGFSSDPNPIRIGILDKDPYADFWFKTGTITVLWISCSLRLIVKT